VIDRRDEDFSIADPSCPRRASNGLDDFVLFGIADGDVAQGIKGLDPVTGGRKRKWHSYSRGDGTTATRKEAEAECRRLLTELEGGAYIDPTKETIASFLDRWLAHMQGQVSPRSHERYAELCRKNIAPLLGGISLTKLQPAHISAAYSKALTSGHRQGRGR
jgi:hypothetical protein